MRKADCFISCGLAVCWRKSLQISFLPVHINHRIIELYIDVDDMKYTLLNIYDNFDYSNLDIFLDCRLFSSQLSIIYTE